MRALIYEPKRPLREIEVISGSLVDSEYYQTSEGLISRAYIFRLEARLELEAMRAELDRIAEMESRAYAKVYAIRNKFGL